MAKLRNLYKIADPQIRAKNILELRRAAKGVIWQLTRPQMADPVFVVGCSRSGTTVTYETIATSPRLISLGHEVPEFWNSLYGPSTNNWSSEAAGSEDARPEHRDAALRFFYQRLGAGRVLDKTCINVMRIPYLYALFPNAKFVFIQRDGRDNVSSMIDGWRENGHFGLTKHLGSPPCEVRINNGEFIEWNFFLPPGWREYNHSALEEACAYQWITANRLALEAKQSIPPGQWIHIRYEDIFERPIEMFREVFERLNIPFEESQRERCRTLDNRPTSIVKGLPQRQKWRSRNPEMIDRILPMISPMMGQLGYGANA